MRLSLCLWAGLAALAAANPPRDVGGPDTYDCNAFDANGKYVWEIIADEDVCRPVYSGVAVQDSPACNCTFWPSRDCTGPTVSLPLAPRVNDAQPPYSYKCYRVYNAPGTVTVTFNEESGMSGSNETNNAWGICAYGFYYSWGKYQSLYQAKGAFCQYYTGPGCLQEIQGELDSGEGDIFIADIEKDFHHFVSYSCGPSKINGSTYEKPTDGD